MALFYVGIFLVAFYLHTIFLGWRSLRVMSRMQFREVDDQDLKGCYKEVENLVSQEWVAANAFHRIGVYDLGHPRVSMYLVAWQHGDEPTYLFAYLAHGKSGVIEILSLYERDYHLGTTNSPVTHAWPAPSTASCQSFSTRSVEQLWAKHLQGMAAMHDRLNVKLPEKAPRPFLEMMEQKMKQQVTYIRSVPLWPWGFIYWLLVRQRIRHGMTVDKQLERRMGR